MKAITMVCAVLVLAACAPEAKQSTGAATTPAGATLTDHAVAGQTLRCDLGGAAADITFSRSGTISGRFLRATIEGTWSPVSAEEIRVVTVTASERSTDNLKLSGGAWVGSSVRCG